jgi:cytochrome o ubiquinol oxidase subunit 2
MAAPVDRPVVFRLTSSSVWNTFYVPALAGMVYAMPGMETKLNAVINSEGEFMGMSAHYSGSGFSRMTFNFRGVTGQGFDEWIAKAKAAASPLDRNAYLQLEKPSEAEPVRYYGAVESGLYDVILGMCVRPGQMCVTDMHRIDRMGGTGEDHEENRRRLEYDNRHLQSGDEPPGATVPASGRPARSENQPEGMTPGGPEGTRPDSNQGRVPPANGGGPAPAQLNQPAPRHQH